MGWLQPLLVYQSISIPSCSILQLPYCLSRYFSKVVVVVSDGSVDFGHPQRDVEYCQARASKYG